MTQRYDVFISYSHEDRDLAERISRRLRSYRPPRQSNVSRRLEVFRDVERLTAGSSLDDLLVEQIENARHLVLLASPDSRESEYVTREIEAFLARKDANEVRIVLLRGELEDSLPAILRIGSAEPLYIDLREANRKQFRFETLRLIASLHGVDYAELRREDEARRRWQIAALVTGLICLMLLIVSGFLITTTPSETWQQVPQPVTETWSNALMPVQQVAVQRTDPETVVWLGRNALHAAWLDEARTSWTLMSDWGSFTDRADEIPTELLGKPLYVLTLKAKDLQGETLLDIDSRIFALSDREDAFFVTLSDIELPDGSHEVTPLTVAESYMWLERLEPEPASTLRKLGYSGRDLEGQWTDYTRGGEVVEAYYQGDSSDDAGEVLDATVSAEHIVFSNDEDQNRLLDELQELAYADEIWSRDFVDNDDWLVPTLPDSSIQYFTREEIEDSSPTIMTEPGPENASVEVNITADAAVLKSIDAILPAADYYAVTTLNRSDVAVAMVESIWESHETIQQPAPIHLIKVGEEPWRLVVLPTDQQRSEITDVQRSQDIPSLLIVVTDLAGVFRSLDAGATWEEANFGEAALRQAAETRFILAPGPTLYALALLHDEPGEDVNPLFRLEQRDWMMRWRIGLASILSGTGSGG